MSNSKCTMAVASKMKLSTTDGAEMYNQDHLVQLRKGDRAYDTKCKLTYYHTDMSGVFLVEGTSKVRLPALDGSSISLNAQVQTQINFLDGKMRRRFEDKYSLGKDPMCEKIAGMPLHDTMRMGGSRFVRNLGDVSVTFSCREVMVSAANVTDICYKQVRVVEGGNTYYLDPVTRILLEKGSQTVCSVANVPALQDTKGRIVVFEPETRVVNPKSLQNLVKHRGVVEGKGLYAPTGEKK